MAYAKPKTHPKTTCLKVTLDNIQYEANNTK